LLSMDWLYVQTDAATPSAFPAARVELSMAAESKSQTVTHS